MKTRLATPAYGPLDPHAAYAFASTLAALVACGHQATWDIEAGDSNQARARNVLLHRFVTSDADRLVCIDKDSVFTPEDVLALLAVDDDVVSAMYRKRQDHLEHVGKPSASEERRGALLAMDRVGFGLVVLSRRCAEEMSQGRPSFVARTGASAGYAVADVFSTHIDDDEWVSPDFVFSDRWRALGGRLWLHTGVRIGHVGPQVFR